MNLGTFNFNINNINLSTTNSQPAKLSVKFKEEEVKVSKFDEDSEYSELAGVKGLRLEGNDNNDNVEPPKSPVKLSPKKSSILSFMERKLSSDEAFFSLNK